LTIRNRAYISTARTSESPEFGARPAKLWDADLIALGSHGRRGIGRAFLGSGAEQIIRMAPVPVLVIRSTEARG